MVESERTLTFHIGAHKTGTSALQEHVFPHFPGYLGKYQSERARGLSSFLPEHRALESLWLEVYRLWVLDSPRLTSAVRTFIGQLVLFGERSVLVSSEEFHSWPRKGNRVGNFLSDGWFNGRNEPPHPFIPLLKKIRAESLGQLEIQVVFTVRNQADYVGSRYAQQSGSLAGASQLDFEQRVVKLIQSNDPYLDWASFVDDLKRVVGDDKVLVLIYEDGIESNVVRISGFLGWERKFSSLPRENVKRLGKRRWLLTRRPPTRRGLLGVVIWFFFISLRHTGVVRSFARAALARAEELFRHRGQSQKEEGEIRLDDEHARALLAVYEDSNRRLSKLLVRDLAHLGYFS